MSCDKNQNSDRQLGSEAESTTVLKKPYTELR